jgi:hypothetical protein
MPTAPSTASLSGQSLAQFNAWYAKRLNGTIGPNETANMLPDALAMTVTYETTYLNTPAYLAWAAQDRINREAQWRLAHVDAIETNNASATIPVSLDPSGAGNNPASGIAQSPAAPVNRCTTPGNWSASDATSGTITITASAQAVTVPAGNSGNLKLNPVKYGHGTGQYQIAAGAWTSFTTGQVIALTTGQNLNFRLQNAQSASSLEGSVIDNDTGQTIASVSILDTS